MYLWYLSLRDYLGFLVRYLLEFLQTGSLKLHQMASRISFSELLDRGQYIFILVLLGFFISSCGV